MAPSRLFFCFLAAGISPGSRRENGQENGQGKWGRENAGGKTGGENADTRGEGRENREGKWGKRWERENAEGKMGRGKRTGKMQIPEGKGWGNGEGNDGSGGENERENANTIWERVGKQGGETDGETRAGENGEGKRS